MVKISIENRKALIMDLQAGESQKVVSISFKMSQPGVRKIWHKFLATGFIENQHRTGRPSKLTDRDRRVWYNPRILTSRIL